jgi:hypothetical protein
MTTSEQMFPQYGVVEVEGGWKVTRKAPTGEVTDCATYISESVARAVSRRMQLFRADEIG